MVSCEVPVRGMEKLLKLVAVKNQERRARRPFQSHYTPLAPAAGRCPETAGRGRASPAGHQTDQHPLSCRRQWSWTRREETRMFFRAPEMALRRCEGCRCLRGTGRPDRSREGGSPACVLAHTPGHKRGCVCVCTSAPRPPPAATTHLLRAQS